MSNHIIPYIRQSRKKEKTISLEDQRAAIVAWADKRDDVTLAAEVVEQGVSGSKPWRERELGAAIKAIQEGRAGGIVVAYESRLSRESGLGTAEVWNALEAAGARLVCVAENIDTARDDDQEFNFGIQALFARQEWKKYRKNWAGANDRCARGGVYQGATPPGFDKGRTKPLPNTEGVLPDIETKQLTKNADAKAIAAAFHARGEGKSYSKVRRILEDAGVKTTTGGSTWAVTSLCSLFRNVIYKGTITNGHEHVFPEYAVVSPSVWEAAQPREEGKRGAMYEEGISYDVKRGITREREKRARIEPDEPVLMSPRQHPGNWAVLSGLVFCGNCGHRMTPNANKRPLAAGGFAEHREYCCKGMSGCEKKGRAKATELEALVVESAYDYFANVTAARGGAAVGKDTDSEKLRTLEIEAAEVRKRQAAFIAAVDPTDEGFAERVAELRAAMQAADAAVKNERESTRRLVSPDEMRKAFEAADIDGKRWLVREMLDGVTVRGNKSDGPLADRIEIQYRTLVWDEA